MLQLLTADSDRQSGGNFEILLVFEIPAVL